MIANVMTHIRKLEKELNIEPLDYNLIDDPQEYYTFLIEYLNPKNYQFESNSF